MNWISKLLSNSQDVRVNALLAVLAGTSLCIAFLALTVALVCGVAGLITTYATVSASLVTLATLCKIDKDTSNDHL